MFEWRHSNYSFNFIDTKIIGNFLNIAGQRQNHDNITGNIQTTELYNNIIKSYISIFG